MLNLTALTADIQDLAANQVAQADARAAQAAETLRQLIARKFGAEQAETVKAEINDRLNSSADIPDTDENSSAAEVIAELEGIAAFYAEVAAEIKSGTFPAPTSSFTHSTPMSPDAFWSRIKRSNATIIQASGYVDIHDAAGEHVARWLETGTLLYTPQAAPDWPPTCPDCGGQMVVSRQGGTGLPFWSCANFPFCRGRCEFTAHADDLAATGDERRARYESLARAREMGLVQVSASGQRRERVRAMADARDSALPVQYTTGRNKLFKS